MATHAQVAWVRWNAEAARVIHVPCVLSRAFLESLVCPKCKQSLLYFEPDKRLLCRGCQLGYRLDHHVAVLLVDEAERLGADEVDRLVNLAKDQGLTGV